MDHKKMGTATVGVTVAILLAVCLFLALSTLHHDHAQIVLPPEASSADQSDLNDSEETQGAVSRVEITTHTVQNTVATLSRPEAYLRTLTITNYWSGGEGLTTVTVFVSGDSIRTDMVLPGGQTRHAIRTLDKTYIWYNNERTVYTAANGAFSADAEQWIPTYEDLLALDTAQITQACYGDYAGIDCIYACTEQDGYFDKYWVSVDTGLLVAAEKEKDGAVVYRMEALEVTLGEPDAGRFTLPDGTALHTTAQETS